MKSIIKSPRPLENLLNNQNKDIYKIRVEDDMRVNIDSKDEKTELQSKKHILLESNLCYEVSKTVINLLTLFNIHIFVGFINFNKRYLNKKIIHKFKSSLNLVGAVGAKNALSNLEKSIENDNDNVNELFNQLIPLISESNHILKQKFKL